MRAAWPGKASSLFIEARITEVLYTVVGKRALVPLAGPLIVHSGSLVPIIIIFSVGAACQTNTHAPCILVRTVLVKDGPSHAHSDTRHELMSTLE